MKASAGKRVLMLLENSVYPRDVRVRREALALTEAGYRVTVISPAAAGMRCHEFIDEVHAYRFPMFVRGQGFLGYLWEYGYCTAMSFLISLWVFVRHGFDVVHAHNPPDAFVFIAAFYKLFGRKFVFDHHDLSPEMYYARFTGSGNRLVYRTLVWLEKISCRLADHVIATNESYRAVEMDRGKVAPQRVTVVRNGPDLDRRKPVAPDEQLRRKAPTIIGFAGVMGYQDGVDYLLRALRHLIHDLGRSDFYCVLVGRGDALEMLKALAAELQLEDHVRFTGYVSEEDFALYLSTADICVAPDPSNAFTDRSTMLKILDYMAMSKPMVVFDLPEHRVSADEAALYAKPNDELDFARQIASLMDDPMKRQAMGAAGRRRIEEHLAWTHQVANLLRSLRHTSLGHCQERCLSGTAEHVSSSTDSQAAACPRRGFAQRPAAIRKKIGGSNGPSLFIRGLSTPQGVRHVPRTEVEGSTR